MKVLALWGFFGGLVVGMLIVDILRFLKKPHALSLREAGIWTGTWCRPGRAVRRCRLRLRRNEQGAGVRHRLHRRVVLERGQPLRVPDDLPVLRRPVQIYAESAFLGNHGGDRPAGHLHRHRGDPAVVLLLADLRLRGVPDLRRDQAHARGRGGSRAREEPGAPVLQAHRSGGNLLRLAELLRAPGRAADGDGPHAGDDRDRDDRHHVRRGLDPRHPRDHAGPVHRVHLQHLRPPRIAGAVLRAGGDHGAVPVPAARPLRRPDVHRGQDADLRVRPDPHRDFAGRGGHRPGRVGRRFPPLPCR